MEIDEWKNSPEVEAGLRDLFAGFAMVAIVLKPATPAMPDGIAGTAYELADAMLKARKL